MLDDEARQEDCRGVRGQPLETLAEARTAMDKRLGRDLDAEQRKGLEIALGNRTRSLKRF